VKAAIRWTRANAGRLGVEANRIAVAGYSAGGMLALLAAGTNDKPEFDGTGGTPGVSSKVDACIGVYPLASAQIARGLFGEGGATPEAIAAASPTTYIAAGFAPTIFIHGTADTTVPLSSSIDFFNKLLALNVPTALTAIQGAQHAFDNAALDSVEVMAQSIDLFLDRLFVNRGPIRVRRRRRSAPRWQRSGGGGGGGAPGAGGELRADVRRVSETTRCACRRRALRRRASHNFEPVADWLKLPTGRETLGPMHGDIAVSRAGEVYVSIETEAMGVHVFSPDGRYLRSLDQAPADLHGFVIRDTGDGEHLYGVSLRGQKFVKLTLAGEVVLQIARDAIPREYWTPNRFSTELGVLLSGMDVAPNGDLYVTDGYSSDYVHRFDRNGKYLETFGGKAAPYGFNILHKIAMDTRFDPVRIIATDRLNNRVVHLSLYGEFLGVVNDDLKLPAALAVDGDNVIVGELNGRVTILDKAGDVVTHLGTNTDEASARIVCPRALAEGLCDRGARRRRTPAARARRRVQRSAACTSSSADASAAAPLSVRPTRTANSPRSCRSRCPCASTRRCSR
jgi:dienelactone hydrolase